MGAALVILSLIAGWSMQKAAQHWHDAQPDDPDDFDLGTVSEKFEIANRTQADLNGMEQLLTDLDLCDDDRQTVVEIRWLGDDDEEHTHDLYCDGMNTATQCLRAIAEREVHDLRQVLAYQCQTLAGCTRHRKNSGKNERKARGEC